MKTQTAILVALVLLGLASGEAKAQKVAITKIDNTSTPGSITVIVSITNGAGWHKPGGCAVQLLPPGGAAGLGGFGDATDISAKKDGTSWEITFRGLTKGTKYDVQAIGTLVDNKAQNRTFFSAMRSTAVN
jgi:hypothetical protein